VVIYEMATRLPHEKSTDVHWSAKRKSLVGSGNKRLPGLLKKLAAKFYPDYSYKSATKGPTVKLATGVRKLKCGKAVGNRFDRAVGESIHLVRKYNFDPEVFWIKSMYAKALQRHTLLKTHKKQLMQIYKANTTKTNLSTPYVRLFWKAITDLKLIPQDVQVEVRHPTLNIGTLVDMVAKGKGRKRHPIEFKTGFVSYLDKHTGTEMKHFEEEKVTDSCRNQHQLQLAASSDMYFTTHHIPKEERGEPLIMYFQPTGVKVVTLAEWAKPSVIFQHLGSPVEKKRKARDESMSSSSSKKRKTSDSRQYVVID